METTDHALNSKGSPRLQVVVFLHNVPPTLEVDDAARDSGPADFLFMVTTNEAFGVGISTHFSWPFLPLADAAVPWLSLLDLALLRASLKGTDADGFEG